MSNEVLDYIYGPSSIEDELLKSSPNDAVVDGLLGKNAVLDAIYGRYNRTGRPKVSRDEYGNTAKQVAAEKAKLNAAYGQHVNTQPTTLPNGDLAIPDHNPNAPAPTNGQQVEISDDYASKRRAERLQKRNIIQQVRREQEDSTTQYTNEELRSQNTTPTSMLEKLANDIDDGYDDVVDYIFGKTRYKNKKEEEAAARSDMNLEVDQDGNLMYSRQSEMNDENLHSLAGEVLNIKEDPEADQLLYYGRIDNPDGTSSYKVGIAGADTFGRTEGEDRGKDITYLWAKRTKDAARYEALFHGNRELLQSRRNDIGTDVENYGAGKSEIYNRDFLGLDGGVDSGKLKTLNMSTQSKLAELGVNTTGRYDARGMESGYAALEKAERLYGKDSTEARELSYLMANMEHTGKKNLSLMDRGEDIVDRLKVSGAHLATLGFIDRETLDNYFGVNHRDEAEAQTRELYRKFQDDNYVGALVDAVKLAPETLADSAADMVALVLSGGSSLVARVGAKAMETAAAKKVAEVAATRSLSAVAEKSLKQRLLRSKEIKEIGAKAADNISLGAKIADSIKPKWSKGYAAVATEMTVDQAKQRMDNGDDSILENLPGMFLSNYMLLGIDRLAFMSEIKGANKYLGGLAKMLPAKSGIIAPVAKAVIGSAKGGMTEAGQEYVQSLGEAINSGYGTAAYDGKGMFNDEFLKQATIGALLGFGAGAVTEGVTTSVGGFNKVKAERKRISFLEQHDAPTTDSDNAGVQEAYDVLGDSIDNDNKYATDAHLDAFKRNLEAKGKSFPEFMEHFNDEDFIKEMNKNSDSGNLMTALRSHISRSKLSVQEKLKYTNMLDDSVSVAYSSKLDVNKLEETLPDFVESISGTHATILPKVLSKTIQDKFDDIGKLHENETDPQVALDHQIEFLDALSTSLIDTPIAKEYIDNLAAQVLNKYEQTTYGETEDKDISEPFRHGSEDSTTEEKDRKYRPGVSSNPFSAIFMRTDKKGFKKIFENLHKYREGTSDKFSLKDALEELVWGHFGTRSTTTTDSLLNAVGKIEDKDILTQLMLAYADVASGGRLSLERSNTVDMKKTTNGTFFDILGVDSRGEGSLSSYLNTAVRILGSTTSKSNKEGAVKDLIRRLQIFADTKNTTNTKGVAESIKELAAREKGDIDNLIKQLSVIHTLLNMSDSARASISDIGLRARYDDTSSFFENTTLINDESTIETATPTEETSSEDTSTEDTSTDVEPTIEEVAAKIAKGKPLTSAEQQVRQNNVQEVEAELQRIKDASTASNNELHATKAEKAIAEVTKIVEGALDVYNKAMSAAKNKQQKREAETDYHLAKLDVIEEVRDIQNFLPEHIRNELFPKNDSNVTSLISNLKDTILNRFDEAIMASGRNVVLKFAKAIGFTPVTLGDFTNTTKERKINEDDAKVINTLVEDIEAWFSEAVASDLLDRNGFDDRAFLTVLLDKDNKFIENLDSIGIQAIISTLAKHTIGLTGVGVDLDGNRISSMSATEFQNSLVSTIRKSLSVVSVEANGLDFKRDILEGLAVSLAQYLTVQLINNNYLELSNESITNDEGNTVEAQRLAYSKVSSGYNFSFERLSSDLQDLDFAITDNLGALKETSHIQSDIELNNEYASSPKDLPKVQKVIEGTVDKLTAFGKNLVNWARETAYKGTALSSQLKSVKPEVFMELLGLDPRHVNPSLIERQLRLSFEEIRDLQGYTAEEVSTVEDLDDMYNSILGGKGFTEEEIASAEGKQLEVLSIVKSIDKAGADGESMYMNHTLGKNIRLYSSTNGVGSFQHVPFLRYLFNTGKNKATEISMTKNDELKKFKEIIVETLEDFIDTGIKVEATSPSTKHKLFKKLADIDPTLLEAVDFLFAHPEQMTRELAHYLNENIPNIDKGKNLVALFAYNQYKKAEAGGKSSFVTNVQGGIDGIVSALSFASPETIDIGSDKEAATIFASVGLITETLIDELHKNEDLTSEQKLVLEGDPSLADLVEAKLITDDGYTRIAKVFFNSLRKGRNLVLLENLVGKKLLDDEGNITSAARNFAKFPFMQYIYGAQKKRVSDEAGKFVIETMIETLDTLYDPVMKETLTEEEKATIEEFRSALKDLYAQSKKTPKASIEGNLKSFVAENEEDIAKYISQVLTTGIYTSIDDTNNALVKNNEDLSVVAGLGLILANVIGDMQQDKLVEQGETGTYIPLVIQDTIEALQKTFLFELGQGEGDTRQGRNIAIKGKSDGKLNPSSIPVKGADGKTRKLTFKKPQLQLMDKNGAVKVYWIHSNDAKVLAPLIELGYLQIYDNVITSPLTRQEVEWLLNVSYFHNVFEEQGDTTVFSQAEKHINKLIDKIDNFSPEQLEAVIKAINADDSFVGKMLKQKLGAKSGKAKLNTLTKTTFKRKLATFAKDLQAIHKKAVANRTALKNKLTVVSQYGYNSPVMIENGKIIGFFKDSRSIMELDGKQVRDMTTEEIIKALQDIITKKVANTDEKPIEVDKNTSEPNIGKSATFTRKETFNKNVVGKRSKARIKDKRPTNGTLSQEELNRKKFKDPYSIKRLVTLLSAIKAAISSNRLVTFDIETIYEDGKSILSSKMYDITFVNSKGVSFNIFYKPEGFDEFVDTEAGKESKYYEGARAAQRKMEELPAGKGKDASSRKDTDNKELLVESKEEFAEAIYKYLMSTDSRPMLNAYNGTLFDFPVLQNLAIEANHEGLMSLLEEGTDYVDLFYTPAFLSLEKFSFGLLGKDSVLDGTSHTSAADTVVLAKATEKLVNTDEQTIEDTYFNKKSSSTLHDTVMENLYNSPNNTDEDSDTTPNGTPEDVGNIFGSENSTGTANSVEATVKAKVETMNNMTIEGVFNDLLSRDDVGTTERIYLRTLFNVLVKPMFTAGREALFIETQATDDMVGKDHALRKRSKGDIEFKEDNVIAAIVRVMHKIENTTSSERSSARIFLHELIHLVFEPVILNNQVSNNFPEEFKQLEKLYRKVKAFRRKGETFGLTEAQLDYIFKGENKNRDIFELISHILESGDVAQKVDELIEIDNLVTIRKIGTKSTGIVGFFETWFEKIVDFIVGSKNGEYEKVSDLLIDIGIRVQGLQSYHKMGLMAKLSAGIRDSFDSMTYKSRYSSTMQSAYEAIMTRLGVDSNNPHHAEIESNPFTLLKVDPINPLGSLLQEYLPSSAAIRPYTEHHLEAKKTAKAVNTITKNIARLILGTHPKTERALLKIDEDEQLFTYIGMFDIKALLDRTKQEVDIANIIEILSEEKVLIENIQEIVEEVKDILGRDYSYATYAKQVQEAAARLVDTARGVANDSKYIHATSIASTYDKIDSKRLEVLTDKLITLRAIEKPAIYSIFQKIAEKAVEDDVYYNAIRQGLSIDKETDNLRLAASELRAVDSIQPKGLPTVVDDDTVMLLPVLMTEDNAAIQEKLGNELIEVKTTGSIRIGIYKSTKSKAENLLSGSIGLIDLAHKDTYSLRSILLADGFTEQEAENIIVNETTAWTDRSVSAVKVEGTIHSGTDMLIKISEELKLEHYSVDKRFSTAISHRRREIVEYTEYKKHNIRALSMIYKDYKENFLQNPDNFVWIGEGASTNKLKGVYDKLPHYMKLALKNKFPTISNEGKGLWVRKESLVQMYGIDGSSANGALDNLGINNKSLRRWIKFTENGIIEIMSQFKQKIVQKLMDTIVGNIISNTMLELAKGRMNPIEIIKLTLKNFKEIIRLNQLDKEISSLRIKRREYDEGSKKYNTYDNKIKELEQEREDSYLYYLVEEGFNDIFIDDVNTLESGYMTDLEKKWYRYGERNPGIKKVLDFAFINKGTSMNKWLNTTFMVSDVAAQATSDILDKRYLEADIRKEFKYYKQAMIASGSRYSYENFRSKKRKQFELERKQKLAEMTIMYHIASGNAALNYLDRLGVLPFYKYQTRIKRVLLTRTQDYGVGGTISSLFQLLADESLDMTLAQESFFNLWSGASFSMIDNGISVATPAMVDNLQWIFSQR